MKRLWLQLLAVFVLTLTGMSAISVAQERSDIPGPPATLTASQHAEESASEYTQPIIRNDLDEYGSFSVNGYLGNLGAATKYVAVPHSSMFGQDVDGSVEMWVNPRNFANTPILISKGNTSAQSFLFAFSGSTPGQLFFRIGTTVYSNTGGSIPPLNQWSHIAATWSGGPSNFTVAFYVNGALSGTAVTAAATFNINTDSVIIGGSKTWPTEYFDGDIDEVRFWGSARTQQQIATNRFVGVGDGGAANAGNALTSSTAYDQLIASWTFNTTGMAFDDISGLNGFYRGGATAYGTAAGQPIPYNFALLCPGGAGDYLAVPSSTALDQTADGSMEAWIRLSTAGVLNPIVQKGASFTATTFAFYITLGNKIGLNIGPHNYISSGPATFAAGQWYHVAATWTGGPNFTVRLYVNGVLDNTQTYNQAMPVNTDSLWIGRYYTTTRFQGYIDELRIWAGALSQQQILRNMFVSGRALLPNPSLIALWNFDGNLNNFSSIAGLNASFANANSNPNACRMSAFLNESTSGPISTSFSAHASVINRGDSPNSFPGGYTQHASFKAIPDNTPAGINDTISIATSRVVTSVEVFLSVEHTYVGDLIVTLRAPNGQSRTLTTRGGGNGENILSFFNDTFGEQTSSTTYLAPWGWLKPATVFGNFGGANALGNWILNVSDNAGADVGVLEGWGLRFNNITGVEMLAGELPREFKLEQNYPNPFNPSTAIQFSVPTKGLVTLTVYDILGKEVTTLLHEEKDAGSYKVQFDASRFASGTYLYRIVAGNFVETKKMLLLK